MPVEEVIQAFQNLRKLFGTDRYWYLRRIPDVNLEAWHNEFADGLPRGYAGFINLISVLLLMRKSRLDNQLIEEEKRDEFQTWNQYFQETFLSTFPDAANYQRMYNSAQDFGILNRLFPLHGTRRSPIATVLAYSGYFYLKLLRDDVDLEALSEYCQTTVEELQEKKEKIDQLKNEPELTPEDIAEELQIPRAVAIQLSNAFGARYHNANLPRICRKDGELVYLLPRGVDFGFTGVEEILYKFYYGQGTAPTRVRYKRVGEGYRHYDPKESLDLTNCTGIEVIRKRDGIQEIETKNFLPIYVFEGNSEKAKSKNELRSNTQYTCLKSGLCPEDARIVIENPDGSNADFHNGDCLPAGGKLRLVSNDGETILAFDVNTGNEIEYFAFLSSPVCFVSQRDIPCFSVFPEFEIGAVDAEVKINDQEENQIDDFTKSQLYGEISITVHRSESVRRKRCRVLPGDLTVSVNVNGNETTIDPDNIDINLDFDQSADIIFRSTHLADGELIFHLPAMNTTVACTLRLDNGCAIPIKFEIPRSSGAYVSIENQNIALIRKKPRTQANTDNLPRFDWDDFKNSGKLHISRAPDQPFAVLLKGGPRLRGARFRTLTLDHADLCEMVDYDEAELLNITEVDVIFQEGNNYNYFSIGSYSSSLKEVKVHVDTQSNNLVLTFPYAKTLDFSNLFLVLKKVEEQAGENLLVQPENFDAEKIETMGETFSVSKSLRCKIQCGFLPETKQRSGKVRIIVPAFFTKIESDFPAQAYLGFVLKPGKYNGFIRCTQGFFVQTNWSPENEEEYFRKLMCGKEFLDNRNPESIKILEEKFRSSDEHVCNFIDRFLEFCKFTNAQSFMDVCFHRMEKTQGNRLICIPSGYIFLAAKYWLERLINSRSIDELLLYWDPELFPIGVIESEIASAALLPNCEFQDILDIQDLIPKLTRFGYSFFRVFYQRKTNNDFALTINELLVDQEIDRVTREKSLGTEREGLVQEGCRTLIKYAKWLYEWRKQSSLCYPNPRQFYNLRYILHALRNEYPLCYLWVAEQAWKLEKHGISDETVYSFEQY